MFTVLILYCVDLPLLGVCIHPACFPVVSKEITGNKPSGFLCLFFFHFSDGGLKSVIQYNYENDNLMLINEIPSN